MTEALVRHMHLSMHVRRLAQMPSNFRRILQRRRALRRNPSGFRSAMRIRRGMTIGKGWSLHGNSGLD